MGVIGTALRKNVLIGGGMKPKNFPARKLLRKLRAEGKLNTPEAKALLEEARGVRTKKRREK